MRRMCVGVLLLAVSAGILSAQTSPGSVSPWTLTVSPAFTVPLLMGDLSSEQYFAPAYGGSLGVEYSLGATAPLSLTMTVGGSAGSFLPDGTVTVSGVLGEASVLAGATARLGLGPRWALRAFVDAGGGYGWISGGTGAFYPVARAGAGAFFALDDSWGLSLDATWVQKFGVYGGLEAVLGTAYHISTARPITVPAERPRPLAVSAVNAGAVFPIFRSYYDTHSLGTATITNQGTAAVLSVRVGFLIKQYMDGPKECAVIPRIEPGQSVQVPLYALFNDRILDVTEGTKVTGEITVETGDDPSVSKTASVLVYDRNAMTWDDDRHAAAFVSSKDPWVLNLSGNFVADVKDSQNGEVPHSLQVAAAIHEGLAACGLSYVLSANRPFLKEGGDLSVVDTLKFPRQTLEYRAGDCADLSVLYASCLESAGIETAFITTPGHILMAFDLGLTADQARARGMDASQLVIQGDRVWVPLETTIRDSDMLDVWRKGASEWHEASAAGTAAFYPMHEAWKTFAPVGLPANGSSAAAPAPSTVRSAFELVLARLVDRELNARLALLGPMPTGGAKAAAVLNARGVLFAKYGRLSEAEKALKEAAADGSTVALINLGNIALLEGKAAVAYTSFRAAAQKNPDDARLFISMARAASLLGRTSDVEVALQSAKRLNPDLAASYESLLPSGGSGTRAAEASSVEVIWY